MIIALRNSRKETRTRMFRLSTSDDLHLMRYMSDWMVKRSAFAVNL